MTLKEYVSKINEQYVTGNATEHSYRPALQNYLESLLPGFMVTNEPSRIDCGAPDFIITKGNMPVAFVEAKDVFDGDLDGRKKHKEQFDRYKESLSVVVFTDYLDFHLYKNNELIQSIQIAEEKKGKIIPIANAEERFNFMMQTLAQSGLQPITSADKLAEQMAIKARLLKDSIIEAFKSKNLDGGDLQSYYETFKLVLIHDLTEEKFADIYAQTIVYGMFAARLHDNTPENFSRQEASELIPKSIPFLRKIFQQIAGYDLDIRISWIIDDLVQMFASTDVSKVMRNFTKNKLHNDPLIHFYESFLGKYDKQIKKDMGVFYTPYPVVKFIVGAVDTILQKDFDLPMGLADYSIIQHKVVNDKKTKTSDKNFVKKPYHRVQILDPATGTGTFLAEVANRIYGKYFANQQGMWQSYVESHLIPRLNGFEIMMSPYSIAHLKMDMVLQNTGFVNNTNERFRIYLTNSLEESHPDTGTLFANFLAQESNEANYVKRDAPVMVMIGNPPYNAISNNNSEWILNKINDYKYINGEYFNERKHWLNDDYVKFIRLAEDYVQRNNSGIVAFITNHNFIDNVTFRGMRHHLLQTFDKVYILDLHGNSKKKEVCPDGSADENIFDIQTGVSINIFVKKSNDKKELGKIYYAELYGSRKLKYEYLSQNNIDSVNWKDLNVEAPNYFFSLKDFSLKDEYEKGFKIDALMQKNVSGIVTMGDGFAIARSKDEMRFRLENFLCNDYIDEDLNRKYSLKKNYANFILANKGNIFIDDKLFAKISYRPFDTMWTYYDNKILWRHRIEIMKHILNRENITFVIGRQCVNDWSFVFCSELISEFNLTGTAGRYGSGYVFPLYLYPKEGNLETKRRINFDESIVKNFMESLNQNFEAYKADPEKYAGLIFDYIYAVLHSPKYRTKYKEFLKINFPRIPYPTSVESFKALSQKGKELRELHLMKNAESWKTPVTFPIQSDENGLVSKVEYDTEKKRVYINNHQYFENVSQIAWEFYIGGYQPAQRWLKDRKKNEISLDFDQIRHYMNIIYALENTARLMQDIDNIWGE